MESLKQSDEEAAAVQKTPNRVSLDDMMQKIEAISYLRPAIEPTMTICLVKMRNGFIVLGKSAPADPENFNEELGEKFAREDAIRQIWPLEGYALRERIAADQMTAAARAPYSNGDDE